MGTLKITAVETFLTAPNTQRLIVVKVHTSEPGLTGLGCATYTQRHLAVKAALDHHIGPYVIGRDPNDIEDLWQGMMVNGYWRNGPVLNNAISGVDMALWDIKGKLANMPCYQLWGGKCRPGARVYRHAGGKEPAEVIDSVRRIMATGCRHVRVQLGGYVGAGVEMRPKGAPEGVYFDDKEKLRRVPPLLEAIRNELGDEVELIHDVHERLAPIDAVWLAKAVEPYRLFFLEDLLAPEDIAWFAQVRSVCSTALAMGELFNHPHEYVPCVTNRWIDFARIHLSQLGGVTPALKLAHLCHPFGVRTAWHGPADVSPVGMVAVLHLDVSCHNYGIQEWGKRTDDEQEMFPGLPLLEGAYVYPTDKPGWGLEFDEKVAAEFPCDDDNPTWTVARLPDGTLWRP